MNLNKTSDFLVVQIVTGDNEVAGVQRHAAWLAKTSSFRHIILLSKSDKYEEFLRENKVPFVSFTSVWQCFGLLLRLRPDCVHAHLGQALILGAFYKTFIRYVPLVFTQHILLPRSSVASNLAARMRNLFLREAYKTLDLLIAVSQAVAKETLKRRECFNIRVVLNGASIAWRDSPRIDLLNNMLPLKVIGLSRMEPEKRPFDFIEVAKRINSNKVTIKVFGAGQLLEACRSAAAEELKDCATKVEYVGYEANIEQQISQGQLYLHFGREEACPLSLIEVQRQGLPVVTYGVGGNVELVPKANGVLVPEGDFVAAAAAVWKFANNRDLLMSASNACRAFAKGLTQQVNTEQIDAIYKELFNAHQVQRIKNQTCGSPG